MGPWTFVEATDFNASVPCLNVTSPSFSLSNDTTAAASSSSSDGLSTGAKAGIAVGTVVGSLAIVGIAAFVLLRNKKKNASPEAPPVTKQVSKLTGGFR
jgi:Na+/H+-translocating membrane pyrophosphatase